MKSNHGWAGMKDGAISYYTCAEPGSKAMDCAEVARCMGETIPARYVDLGNLPLELADSFADDCLSINDSRLTGVVKGYVMQALVYGIDGEVFCIETACRLFNAHRWHEFLEELVGETDEYYRKHEELLRYQAKECAK